MQSNINSILARVQTYQMQQNNLAWNRGSLQANLGGHKAKQVFRVYNVLALRQSIVLQ